MFGEKLHIWQLTHIPGRPLIAIRRNIADNYNLYMFRSFFRHCFFPISFRWWARLHISLSSARAMAHQKKHFRCCWMNCIFLSLCSLCGGTCRDDGAVCNGWEFNRFNRSHNTFVRAHLDSVRACVCVCEMWLCGWFCNPEMGKGLPDSAGKKDCGVRQKIPNLFSLVDIYIRVPYMIVIILNSLSCAWMESENGGGDGDEVNLCLKMEARKSVLCNNRIVRSQRFVMLRCRELINRLPVGKECEPKERRYFFAMNSRCGRSVERSDEDEGAQNRAV